jgi:DNA-binding winged helix-turn-helix (wHTH) protein
MKPLSIKNYEFGPFLLDTHGQCLIRDNEQIQLQPKAFQVLLHLVQNAGHTVSRDELITDIWGLSISDGVLNFQISQIRKLLGDVPAHPQYIKTITKRGFQFIAPVKEVAHLVNRPIPEPAALVEPSPTPLAPAPSDFAPSIGKPTAARRFVTARESEKEPKAIAAQPHEGDAHRQEIQHLNGTTHLLNANGRSGRSLASTDGAMSLAISARLDWLFGGHLWHVLIACVLYAGLYVVTLLTEIAYQFDSYGSASLWASPIVYLWIFGTSIIGLVVIWKSAAKGKPHGLVICLLIFLGAAAVLYAGICLLLPSSSITELTHQPYPAQAAYLKDICYSLLLVVIFLIPTFHFIIKMQQELRAGRHRLALELLTGKSVGVAPSGMIYPSFWILALILMAMAAFSVYLTANLLDHLSPGPYRNLFVNLIYLRLILYYGFGLKSLGWYYQALNQIKRESRTAANSLED